MRAPTQPPIQGWSACGKFVNAEVRSYTHFVVSDRLSLLTQLFNVLVVIAALTVYIWRQIYQTRKFQGMLYQRVHGRRSRIL